MRALVSIFILKRKPIRETATSSQRGCNRVDSYLAVISALGDGCLY